MDLPPDDRTRGVLLPAILVALAIIVVAALALASRGVDGSTRRDQTLEDVLEDDAE